MKGLAKGRVVIYLAVNGEEFAAIITKVKNDDGVCNLFVLYDNEIKAPRIEYSVPYSEFDTRRHVWFWPKIV